MSKININEENNCNASKNENTTNFNNLEINLLDTFNDKDLFKNNINNDDNNNHNKINGLNEINNYINDINYLTENYQLDVNEIIDKNSDNNSNSENNNISNKSNNEKKDFEEIEKNNNDNNYVDFNSFMKAKVKKNEIKISKSFSSSKIKYKKISTPVIINKYKTNKKIKEKNNNEVENEKKKVKQSKERIELNKQRLNKLYCDYKKILEKIENKKKELSEEEIKDCSFSPKINKHSKKITENNSKFSKPIYLRYNDDLSRKNILLKKYQLNFTHIPKINKKFNLYLTNNENILKNINTKIIKNKKLKENKKNNNTIKNANIIKRKLLLDEYINNKKIMNFNNEDISLLNLKTTTSELKFPINHCKIKLKKFSKYPIVKNLNLEKYFDNNISRNKKDKKLLKSKSFYLDYIKEIDKKINQKIVHKQNITPIISINEMDKYFIYNYNKSFITNPNYKENVITNFIDKINSHINNFKQDNKGICYNIKEQCMNIKKIILKNKRRSFSYK